MSTLKEQLDDLQPPKQAWVWTTETMKNCMLGKHELEHFSWHKEERGERCNCMGAFGSASVCKHCRCLFVEKS